MEPPACAAVHPAKAHMRWRCGNLTFRADFDGGNLGSAVAGVEAGTFTVAPAPECAGTPAEVPFRVWYHFAVSGGSPGRTIRVTIEGMHQISKVYNTDLRPLVRVVERSADWER